MAIIEKSTAVSILFAAILLFTPAYCQAANLVDFITFEKNEFSPSRKQSIKIPFVLNQKAKVTIEIFACDGDAVRELSSVTELPPGEHNLVWDGKDDQGIIVPDEAYSVVLHGENKKHIFTIDPRKTSGGEMEKNLASVITATGEITYTLSKPSRVRIRAGIVDGPMLRSIQNWTPRPAGKNVQRWNGLDENKVVDILSLPNFGISISAFNLPDFTIITTGNNYLDYPTYYALRNWSFIPLPAEDQLVERGNKGISPHYYYWRVIDKDPRIQIIFPDNQNKDAHGLSVVENNKPIAVKVVMAAADEAYMIESKYEVSFFVDFEFKSEEELGFMPITWLWTPNNLNTGEHFFTVNVSGFRGQVGVTTTKFIVK